MNRTQWTAGLVGLTCALISLPAWANLIQVQNVQLREQLTGEQTVRIEFDLSWDNSWRNDLNHDAAWVFIKFRAPGSNDWQHAYLATNGVNTAPGGIVALGYSAVGAGTNAVGAFIYSASTQTGTVTYSRVRLTWDYGASGYNWPAGEELDVSVHAIEMVYVAQGSFYVGSGGTEVAPLTEGSWTTGASIPFAVTNEAAIEIGQAPGKLWGLGGATGSGGVGAAGTLPAAFPKGYAPFYCMKYETTQGQYVEFLNLLTYAQQASRASAKAPSSAAGTYLYNTNRHTIYIAQSGVNSSTSAVYATDNPYVPCGYLYWPHCAAYAQWAGLRPMTELEYEKACRGPAAPVANEFAWGTANTRSTAYTLDNPGATNEVVTNPNDSDTHGNAIIDTTRPANPYVGPVRVGIFAPATTNSRVRAGASYWGIRDLSGNLEERAVPVSIRTFEGSHGAGTLSSAGHATQADWPGYSAGLITGAGRYMRGGDYSASVGYMYVSDRQLVNSTWEGVENSLGFRAVRSAP